MQITETDLPGVVIIEPARYEDHRGSFMEVWHRQRYAEAGLPEQWVQDNLSYSKRGVLRGLHFQHPSPQAKLVSVLSGEAFDVAVDLRQGAPSFSRWTGVVLSGQNRRQLYIPEGFAHGFVVTSETALVLYKCTSFYAPESEHSMLWQDPDIGIKWPVEVPILSDKDAAAPRLRDFPAHALPRLK